MSQGTSLDGEEEIGQRHHYPPRGQSRVRSLPNRSLQGDRDDDDDDSGALFSMYSKMAAAEDLSMAERWKKDAGSILVFTGLFSATIAALLGATIPDLKESPQDTSNFYLQNINNALINPGSSSGAQPPSFSAPTEAVVVNLLWFLSLLISLSCAIMATVIQQWARQYVRYTQPSQRGPKTRARIRAMFSHSVDKLSIKCIESLLPCYLHLAILFFMIGLLIFLSSLNVAIFTVSLLLFWFSSGVYGFFTILPLFQHDSPLYTPISTFPVWLLASLVCLFHIAFHRHHRFNCTGWGIFDWAFEDVGSKADASAKRRSPEMDTHILEWSLRSLTDDDAVEKYHRATIFPTSLEALPPSWRLSLTRRKTSSRRRYVDS